MNQRPATDPFLLEVLRNAFDTIAEEITLTIIRTAYSQIVRDSLDFSTALCDAEGRTYAQGVCTPMHLGSFLDALRNMLDEVGDDIDPEDYFIMNDPYAAAGQHLPDIYVVKPVFFEGELKGWSTTLAPKPSCGARTTRTATVCGQSPRSTSRNSSATCRQRSRTRSCAKTPVSFMV